jgi:transcriptional regulator with XRE-family HTH domain
MGSLLAEQFGRNLWRQRRLAGLSQAELGELTQLSRVDISAIERGQRLPRLDTILKVSAGVEASPCELLAGLRWRPGHFHYVEGDFYVEGDPASDAEGPRRDRA